MLSATGGEDGAIDECWEQLRESCIHYAKYSPVAVIQAECAIKAARWLAAHGQFCSVGIIIGQNEISPADVLPNHVEADDVLPQIAAGVVVFGSFALGIGSGVYESGFAKTVLHTCGHHLHPCSLQLSTGTPEAAVWLPGGQQLRASAPRRGAYNKP
ncbi:hypothetical protein HPB50_001653 [Hyalomma asiaticum]|uniref:Uncharacterized protein n=1 Tax=Hyalomma asiaticum TaxID=266040 RepID=A0ACB7RXG7_HYAAI|nr:hypothetical protein HPB50_001653 [Hyalomma asiaticum]